MGVLMGPRKTLSPSEGSDSVMNSIIIVACVAGVISVLCYTCGKIREVCNATRAEVYQVEHEDENENDHPHRHVECGDTKQDK